MKRPAKKQPKRKARVSDCAFARELARRFRENDPYTFDAGSEDEYQIGVSGKLLCEALLSFADHGTFDRFRKEVIDVDLLPSVRAQRLAAAVLFKTHPLGLIDVRDGELIFEYPKGMKTIDAISQVADEFDVTEDIVKNAIYPRPKRKKLKT